MGKILGIIGAGHLGQQIAHYAISDGPYESVVFFDDYTAEKTCMGFPVLGTLHDVPQAYMNQKFDEILIGIGYKHLAIRKQVFQQLEPMIPFGTLIHSSCWVDTTATIARGTVLYPQCSIDAHVTIGANTIINIGCTIAHDTQIGAHCFLSPRVALAGFISIEEQCILGINATFIDSITVAAQTQIGGGTVVIDSITEKGLYVGNPHRKVR